jgi:hypothetical protein
VPPTPNSLTTPAQVGTTIQAIDAAGNVWPLTSALQAAPVAPVPQEWSFAPLYLDNCVLWLPMDREVTVGSGTVSAAADESGAGNSVSQGTPANQPAFNQSDSIYGDAPTLSFNGVATSLVTPTWNLVQPFTVYCVGEIDNAGGAMWEGSANRIILRTSAGHWQFFAGSLVTSANGDTNPHVFCVVYNGASSALFVDRFDVADTTGNSGAGGWDLAIFGGGGGLGDPLQGKIASIAVYKGAAHSSAQRERVMKAMGSRASNASLIVCDGNSLTLGPGGGVIPYPTQLGTLIGDSTYTIVNNGVGGETTPAMNTFAVNNTDPRFTCRLRRQLALGWEITNDVFFGASANTAYSNIVQYSLSRRAVGWKVVAFTFLSRSNSGTPVGFNATRATVNARIRQNWRTWADALCDVAADPRIGPDGAETQPAFFDGSLVHLNTLGMSIVAQLALNAIQTIQWP